ncbi:hypothetical protein BpHYR1_026135 [Brachionus plicatilis]|uniref:Uncharacterized protein n=1 Tax=Brachionus plicatilis TaxID=10195 RepID=A0A3M7T7M4_BRAPC|nr:hypothetical protein BpHYR1_026135 [Brachionus plicatilis]
MSIEKTKEIKDNKYDFIFYTRKIFLPNGLCVSHTSIGSKVRIPISSAFSLKKLWPVWTKNCSGDDQPDAVNLDRSDLIKQILEKEISAAHIICINGLFISNHDII